MLDHAAGTLPPGLHLAAELHRLLSDEGNRTASLWEAVGKGLAGQEAGCASRTRHKRLAEAFAIINTDYATVRWRRGLSGVQYAPAKASGGQLMHLEPGQKVLAHGHSALEATVILDGTLEDGLGTFVPGDIVLGEPGVRHRPAAHGNRPCTCFVARASRPFWRLT